LGLCQYCAALSRYRSFPSSQFATISLSLFVASGRGDCLRAFFVFIMTAYTEADLAAELEQSKLNVQLSVLLLF
jgi:hypothetical protein